MTCPKCPDLYFPSGPAKDLGDLGHAHLLDVEHLQKSAVLGPDRRQELFEKVALRREFLGTPFDEIGSKRLNDRIGQVRKLALDLVPVASQYIEAGGRRDAAEPTCKRVVVRPTKACQLEICLCETSLNDLRYLIGALKIAAGHDGHIALVPI